MTYVNKYIIKFTYVHCSGYLGPGGRHEDGAYFNCTGGATGYIDRVILTLNHIYQKPTIKHVYGAGAFDPEGILGNFYNFLIITYIRQMIIHKLSCTVPLDSIT